jgi:transcriptional regulator with XRE-family HTH domain
MREWLRQARESAGLTQKQLGEKVNKNITTIGKYENGTRRPSYEVAKRIASILGFDWTLFFENEAEKESQ